jgi:excisionase family DNA binding protein
MLMLESSLWKIAQRGKLRVMAKKASPVMLTVREVAERTGASQRSVRLWAQQGKFPGARLEDSPAGSYWVIPATALDGFELRGRGRPPKPKAENGKEGKAK